MTRELNVGDSAPDFELEAHTGERVRLAELRQQGPVIVFFYPKDDTPGCIAEACAFRDDFETFTQAGAAVVGISSDTIDSHRHFASKYRFPFMLLSDPGAIVRGSYGVRRTFGIIDGRVTFLIDKQGIVRHRFNSQFNAKGHVAEALKALQQLH